MNAIFIIFKINNLNEYAIDNWQEVDTVTGVSKISGIKPTKMSV